ncbi:MAG TPA: methionine--tRNA ligase, partial [Edaphobacter sp.]|nr:methionine--tRNA ligase [Edaphobacter sp.]
MSDTKKKFYLTTPIYYVNARPHIGHAYTTIAADVIARRHRLLGDDTFFLTGTDEHGQKIERSATAAGIPTQQFADEVSASFESLWKRMGITNDDFIRTTDPRHKSAVQKLFALLQQRGYIELSSYTGQYSVGEEMFVEGPPGTIGPDGKPTETVTEENYFFKLSAFQRQLIDLIESDRLAIQPEVRKNEVLSFLRGNVTEADKTELSAAGIAYVPGALKDLSISRTSFKWGIPVPGDEKHVIYVWLDALTNYMTAIGYGSDDPADQAKFEKYWPADLHLVGKEIIRFHCVYWPAFLLAADLPLPKAITAHGWLLFEDSKMSKSRGNIVRTETILDAFGSLKPEASKAEQDLFASDVLRYFLLREIPFGQDGSFSFDALVQRYNSDLANGYGNLVSRILNLILQNQDGVMVEAKKPWLFRSDIALAEPDPLQRAAQQMTDTGSVIEVLLDRKEVYEHYDNSRFELLTLTLAARIKIVDIYLSSHEPWKLAKSNDSSDHQRMIEVLHTAAEGVRIITALLYPILPYATAKVWTQLGLGDIEESARNGELKNLEWGGLQPGTKLGPLSPIFPRADKGLIQIMTDMEINNAPQKSDQPTPSKFIDEKTTHTSPVQEDPTHPAAPPRTSALNEPNPGAQVGGAAAPAPDLIRTPPHSEAA